jgi:hypothetical protein
LNLSFGCAWGAFKIPVPISKDAKVIQWEKYSFENENNDTSSWKHRQSLHDFELAKEYET